MGRSNRAKSVVNERLGIKGTLSVSAIVVLDDQDLLSLADYSIPKAKEQITKALIKEVENTTAGKIRFEEIRIPMLPEAKESKE